MFELWSFICLTVRFTFRYFKVRFQQANRHGARSELETSPHAKDSQPVDESTTSGKTGKIRLSRLTARSKAPSRPPTEMFHIDQFPPPDMRSAGHQLSIDQLRRNGQLLEHNHEATPAQQNPRSQGTLPVRSKSCSFSLRSSGHLPSTSRCTQVCSQHHISPRVSETPYSHSIRSAPSSTMIGTLGRFSELIFTQKEMNFVYRIESFYRSFCQTFSTSFSNDSIFNVPNRFNELTVIAVCF